MDHSFHLIDIDCGHVENTNHHLFENLVGMLKISELSLGSHQNLSENNWKLVIIHIIRIRKLTLCFWRKTFKVLSLPVNWDLNSERQCCPHFRNKRNPWQTWRTLIPITTTIVDVQTRQALTYLFNFIYIIYPISE